MENRNRELTETSIVAVKNGLVIAGVVLFFLGFIAFSLYKWLALQVRQPADIFFGIMFVVVLLERSIPRYTYSAGEQGVRITKRGLFGTSQQEIPYDQMWGIYRYKAKLIGVVKFRRTYRYHSALDPRAVWVLAYKTVLASGKTENQRIYFKPSQAMLAWLEQQMPGKVHGAEDRVVVNIVKSE